MTRLSENVWSDENTRLSRVKRQTRHIARLVPVAVMGSILLAACSTAHYRESADRETYNAIKTKSKAVPGMDPAFTITEPPEPALDALPLAESSPDFLGETALSEKGAHIVSLERALELAVQHNHTYRAQKESVYLNALGLTLDRHEYTPIFSASGGGEYTHSTKDVTVTDSTLKQAAVQAPEMLQKIAQMTGTPADLLKSYAELVAATPKVAGITTTHTVVTAENSLSADTSAGVDLLLKGGGRIAAGITTNFLRFLTGNARFSATSALAASISQPLLKGAGRRVAAETLTQAERNLLYALRNFARYRQEFTVQICGDYYAVLQARDAARNNYQSFHRFEQNAQREHALEAEGRSKQSNVRRLDQAQLSSENTWVASVGDYKQQLDSFKLELGLSADTPIILDDQELARLKDRGIIHPDISAEDASKVAAASRLDLYTQRDQCDDAERKIMIAKNAFLPKLNATFDASIPSQSGTHPQQIDFQHTHWNAGFDTDLMLDRKAKRNNYRSALIASERAKRDLQLAEDTVTLNVRDSWRNLDQAKRTFEIATQSAEMNRRRVDEQDLLAELGRTTAQDRVDAQNDLTTSENNITAALVSHTVARLRFWRDMGILFIKENGEWEEVTDVPKP